MNANINFVAIDFETANYNSTSICEIGLCEVQNGILSKPISWLVNPQTNRWDFTWLHGIRNEDVKDAPTFIQSWQRFKQIIDGKTIIAHNATFDMYALEDSLNKHNLTYPDTTVYCSMNLARRISKGMFSYSLENLCYEYEIERFEEHRAGDDARACAELVIKILDEAEITDFSQIFEKHKIQAGYFSAEGYYEPPKSLRIYHKESAKEISGDPSKYQSDSIFFGKNVVFTGMLQSMIRQEAQQIIADIGGIPQDNVNKNTDFLIVGMQDISKVGADGLSGKQEKAYKMLQKGHEIEILSEEDFLRSIKINDTIS